MHLTCTYKKILLQSTAKHSIVFNGHYAYDSNYDFVQFKSDERYDNLFGSAIACWEIIKEKKISQYHKVVY